MLVYGSKHTQFTIDHCEKTLCLAKLALAAYPVTQVARAKAHQTKVFLAEKATSGMVTVKTAIPKNPF